MNICAIDNIFYQTICFSSCRISFINIFDFFGRGRIIFYHILFADKELKKKNIAYKTSVIIIFKITLRNLFFFYNYNFIDRHSFTIIFKISLRSRLYVYGFVDRYAFTFYQITGPAFCDGRTQVGEAVLFKNIIWKKYLPECYSQILSLTYCPLHVSP